jgi:LytS/YehU family sensor histidine kinase
VDCVVWAVLTLGVLAMARAFPLERGRMPRSVAMHVLAAFGFHLIATGLAQGLYEWQGLMSGSPLRGSALYRALVVGRLNNDLMAYASVLGLSQAVAYYRRSRERELRASQLEARVAEAQLQALRMQLHPHFLFNTLHAISALMHRDVEAADRMVSKLSDLLRVALDNAGEQEVSLRRELDFLEGYLEIQRARFGDRLGVSVSVDPEVLDARVPNLILQPLVENAIRHGVSARAAGGRIAVAARREGARLRLEVRDDGPGLTAGTFREGLGLANTRARLVQLYGQGQHLSLANQPGGGLRVEVEVPLRLDAAPVEVG